MEKRLVSTDHPNGWGELPKECAIAIMAFLDGQDLWAFVSSTKTWHQIAEEVSKALPTLKSTSKTRHTSL